MRIISTPSCNFDERDGHKVDTLVLHYTGMESSDAALSRMRDSEAKVSAHYMVDIDGKIFQLVREEKRAWHAGVSFWRGNTNLNQRSIGIEIVNKGHEFGYHPFPAPQMQSVAELCLSIISRHPIPQRNVVAHSDIAPSRKTDPGELFDWQFLASNEVGIFPNEKKTANPHLVAASPLKLAEYGYDISNETAAITAFQRHFRQSNLSGQWDNECASLLATLLAMV